MSREILKRKTEWISNWEKSVIEHMKMTQWFWVVAYPENFILGKYVDIGAFTYINAKNGVEFKDYSSIGSHSSIYSIDNMGNKSGKITLKTGAVIGGHSVILPGVTVGEDAIVGAFSLIKDSVPDNELWAGIPARKIKDIDLEEPPG